MTLQAGILIAWKEVWHQKKLLAIVVLALTLGIVNSAVITGVMRGFEKYITEDIVEIMAGQVVILPKNSETIKNSDYVIEKIEKINEIRAVLERLSYRVTVDINRDRVSEETISLYSANMPKMIIGVNAEKEAKYTAFSEKISEGRWLKGEPDEIVVGKKLAEDFMGKDVGDNIVVHFDSGIDHRFKIVGLIETGYSTIDANRLFANIEDLEGINNAHGETTAIFIKLFDKNMAEHVKAMIIGMGITETVQTWDEMLSFIKDLLNVFTVILFVVSGTAIVAASFGIAIMMYINVIKKTKQIGTLKAMGASNEFILAVFLLEAVIIALIGIFVGSICSISLIEMLNKNPLFIGPYKLQFVADYNMLFDSGVISLVFAVLAGIYPAYVASRMQIIEAMRYD